YYLSLLLSLRRPGARCRCGPSAPVVGFSGSHRPPLRWFFDSKAGGRRCVVQGLYLAPSELLSAVVSGSAQQLAMRAESGARPSLASFPAPWEETETMSSLSEGPSAPVAGDRLEARPAGSGSQLHFPFWVAQSSATPADDMEEVRQDA